MTVLSNCHKQTFDETITEEHCSVLDHLRSVTALGWTGTAKAGGRVEGRMKGEEEGAEEADWQPKKNARFVLFGC